MMDKSTKPSIADLAGIDPDFTGGQSPEDYLDDLRSGGEVSKLRAEVLRLQQENGALARTYAACEQMLRERTEQLNQADVEIQNYSAVIGNLRAEADLAHAESEQLRAVVKLAGIHHHDGCKGCFAVQSAIRRLDGDNSLSSR
jgi:hypothetical protein